MPLVWNTTVTLGSQTKRFYETTSADQVNEKDMAFQFNPHPWQRKVIEFATDDEGSPREIMWVYSFMGNAGKSVLSDYMVNNMNAFKVDVREPKRVKLAILTKIEEDETFLDNPIIIVDLPRQASSLAKNKNFYVSLEEIQSNFHSTMYQCGQVAWKVPPKVIVFANCRPDPNMLSGDRLKPYLIDPYTMDMDVNHEIVAQLYANQAELVRLQALEKKRSDEAQRIPLTNTQTYFELNFSLTSSGPGILAGEMHRRMRVSGYNQSMKAMNKWIEEHFCEEIASGVVRKYKRSNVCAWVGFKPK